MDVDVPGTGSPYYECNGVAMVNCVFEMARTTEENQQRYMMLWKRPAIHFLIWHCTFVPPAQPLTNRHFVAFALQYRYDAIGGTYTDIDIRGSSIYSLGSNTVTSQGAAINYTNCVVDENNIQSGWGPLATISTNMTTAVPDLDDNLAPNAGSVLINRMSTALVPGDAANTVRDSTPDLGAYERSGN